MQLTACLIAHNEAHVLRRCLDSIADWVDDCCVVDTGSSDATAEIARAFGARVLVDRSLADVKGRLLDFAAARNRALEMARTEWVLSIDADEILRVRRPETLRRALQAPHSSAIEVKIISGATQWYLPRLFRRMPWTTWRGKVHEWVELRGPTRRYASISIENLPDKAGKESAAERDLRLCRQQLEDEPRNLRAVLYLARALRLTAQYRSAIEQYERYWRESDFAAGRYTAAVGRAVCHLLLHQYGEAYASAMQAYRLDPRLAEACCVVGDALLALGRVDRSLRWFNRALSKQPPRVADFGHFVDLSCYHEYPSSQIRWIQETIYLTHEVESQASRSRALI